MARPKNKKIVVGMSGGIDSSMALVLLKKQGWDPISVTLGLPRWREKSEYPAETETLPESRAKGICEKLGVKHFVVDAKKEFEKEVVGYFKKELKAGRTPNPCVFCNPYLKFKMLFDFADKKGIKYVATGHYAGSWLNVKTGKYELLVPKDKEKDQTYYLSFLAQKMLARLVFPLAKYAKQETTEMAKEIGFRDFAKTKPSQDFCYLNNGDLQEFLEEEIGIKPGKIVDEEGNVLAEHQGVHFYTIGQRKGIGLSEGPYFVKELDKKKNLVIVTKSKKEIVKKEIILFPCNFVSGEKPKAELKVMAKIRYGAKPAEATIFPPEKDKLKIVFDKPQTAITPGQICVFYHGDICLGGGVINN